MIDVIMPTALLAPKDVIMQTIRSLADCTVGQYRLIVVMNSNKSDEESVAYLCDILSLVGKDRCELLLMDGIAGFSRACNFGLVYSKAEWLCLLSDDVTLCDRWDEKIIGHLADSGAALCVPKSKRACRLSSAHRYRGHDDGYLTVKHMLPFFAPVMPRWTIEKYGVLSMHPELSQLGSDDEYCERILRGGDKIILACDCLFDPLRRTTIGRICDNSESSKAIRRLHTIRQGFA